MLAWVVALPPGNIMKPESLMGELSVGIRSLANMEWGPETKPQYWLSEIGKRIGVEVREQEAPPEPGSWEPNKMAALALKYEPTFMDDVVYWAGRKDPADKYPGG
ncbi:hypothetical protein GCM10009720_17620 [Yaniella flava]|uniref:Uncharacterized protein n=1 Tax=Yaniella flava TaxID=287930 RepID=A0ABN2UID2_9MICC